MEQVLLGEAATEKFAAGFAHFVQAPLVITLEGVLGAGKTTFVRGFLRELGFQETVKSPTFTLVESYFLETMDIYHFDLYRLTYPQELEFIGFRDYLTEKSLIFIEWPEKGEGFLPPFDISLVFSLAEEGRRVTVEFLSNRALMFQPVLKQLLKEQ